MDFSWDDHATELHRAAAEFGRGLNDGLEEREAMGTLSLDGWRACAEFGVLGLAGCFIGFCAPNVGGQQQLDYASLVDLKTGEVVWFNVVSAGSEIPGIKFGDLRTSEGAAQMVERLLGRMKPGREVRESQARKVR